MAGIELQFDNSRILSQLRAIERELKQIDASVGRTQGALNRTGSGAGGLDKIGTSARNAGRQIQDLDGWSRKASTSQQQMGQASGRAAGQLGQLRGASRQASGGLTTLISSSTGLVAGLAGIGMGVSAAVSSFIDYDSTLRRVGAISGATEEQMERMRATAQELGASTRFSAGQAAEGLQFLAMAGLDAEESITALPGVLNLAAAGAMDLGTAADIATNILSGYGFEVDQLSRVNDVLAKSFTSSNTNLQQLGTAFTTAGSVAAAAGQEFEVTAGVLSLMANAGFAGERSGTALRGALARLLKPTGEVTDTLARLGIEVHDSSGNLRQLDDIMIELSNTGLSAGDAIALFGQEAGPAMLAAIRQGEEGITGMVEKMRDAEGTAETVAGALKGSLGGSLTELGSVAEGVGIALVDAFDESLVVVISSFTSVLQTAAGVFREHQEIVLAVGLAYGGLMIIRTAVIPAIGLLSTTVLPAATAALTTTTGAVAALRAGLAFLTGPAGILAAVAAGTYLVIMRQDEHKSAVDLAKEANKQLSQVLSDSTTTMSTAAQSTIALSREKLNQARATLAQAAAEEGLLATLDEANEVFGRTDDARSRAAAKIAELSKEVDALESKLGKATNRIMEQGPALRNASQAHGALTIEVNNTATGMDRARVQYDEASKAAQRHAEQVDDLKSMLKAGLIDQGEYTTELERATESLSLVEGATALYEASLEKSTGSTKTSTKATKEQVTELDKAKAAYDDMRSGISDATNASERMLALIRDENLTREQAAALIELENAARKAGVEVTAEQRSEVLGLVADLERNQTAIAGLTTETATGTDSMAESWKTLNKNVQNLFANTFTDLFKGAWDGWRGLLDSMWQLFASWAGQIASQRIMLSVGMGGAGMAGSAAANAAGGGNLLGGISSGLGSVYGGLFGGLGGLLSGGGAGLGFGMASTGAALASEGLFAGGLSALSNIGSLVSVGNFAAALGAAVPILLPVAGLLAGLLGSSTPPRAYALGDIATGDLVQVVEKKGQEATALVGMIDQIVASTQSALGEIGGTLEAGQGVFDLHINPDRLRFSLRLDEGGLMEVDVDPEDQAAVTDAVNRMMLGAMAQADFDDAIAEVGQFFNALSIDMIDALPAGAAQQYVEGLTAIATALNTDPLTLYQQALDQQTTGVLDALTRQSGALQQLISEFDGSAGRTANLAQGLTTLQHSAVQALAQIDAARQSVTDSVASARQQIELSLMSQAEKVAFWLGEAERLREELSAATDPAAIDRLAQDTAAALLSAWQNMDEDRRGSEAEFIRGFLDSIDATAATGLDAAASTVQQIWQAAADDVRTQLGAAAESLRGAAEAIRAAIPSSIHVTSSVTITGGAHDQPGGGRARGGIVRAASGWIGSAGAAGADTIPILVGAGEAVLNRHQQRIVESALMASHGFGLDGLFARESRAHTAGPPGGPARSAPPFAAGGFVPPARPRTDPELAELRAELRAMARDVRETMIRAGMQFRDAADRMPRNIRVGVEFPESYTGGL